MTRRLAIALVLLAVPVGACHKRAGGSGQPDCGGAPCGDGSTVVECNGAGLNACGNCSSECETQSQGGTGEEPLNPPASGSGVVQNPDGSLTLGTSSAATTEFAWPSNDPEGTISRIDTLLNREVGRYATVLKVVGANPADPTGTPDVDEWNSGNNRPSRSTVDGDGNAYVANRAHSGGDKHHGSVTKIGFFDRDLCDMSLALCQCVDMNGDGKIQTSQDCKGYGVNELGECPDEAVAEGHPRQPNGIAVNDAKEFLGYADECLLWTVPLPIPSGVSQAWARAMAIDSDGYVWVGDFYNRRFYKLNPADGAFMPGDPTRPETALSGIAVKGQPYGAVVDSQGGLWYSNDYDYQPGKLQRIDTRSGAVTPVDDYFLKGGPGGYGITVDAKDRIWLASYVQGAGSTGGSVVRYDPSTDTTSVFHAGLGGDWAGRGITATPEGVVWAAFHGGAQIVAFDHDTGVVLDKVDLASRCGAATTIGVGIGAGGSVLAVNQGSNNVCKYDPNDGGSVVAIPIGPQPYTYSDFTGNIFRTFTQRKGTYKAAYVCEKGRQSWLRVEWVGETPGGSSIQVRVKNVASAAELSGAASLGPATQPPDTAFDLTSFGLDQKFLQVEFLLLSDADGNAPTLRSYRVVGMCVSPPA